MTTSIHAFRIWTNSSFPATHSTRPSPQHEFVLISLFESWPMSRNLGVKLKSKCSKFSLNRLLWLLLLFKKCWFLETKYYYFFNLKTTFSTLLFETIESKQYLEENCFQNIVREINKFSVWNGISWLNIFLTSCFGSEVVSYLRLKKTF